MPSHCNFERLAGRRFGQFQKVQPFRKIVERAGGGGGNQCEGNDAHGFLRVVRAVAVAHETSAHELGFAENQVDQARGHAAEDRRYGVHEERTANEPNQWRSEHG